jgi:3,4-dihydroxy 2-butanone 4-phosphate synthase/GTP cyclohydrolase II
MMPSGRTSVEAAVAALAHGGMVVVADDPDRENEGDLVMAASAVRGTDVSFFLRHGSGIVCAPLNRERAGQLDLGLMVPVNTDTHQTAFTVSVDSTRCGTGISAADRATTIRALADPSTRPADLRRPGHVFPLVSRPGGALKRAGHTEAATDLVRLAGLGDVAMITEILTSDGEPVSGAGLTGFADQHGLVHVTIGDLVRYRRQTDQLVRRTGSARLPTTRGVFEARSYVSVIDGTEHLALLMGDLAGADRSEPGVLVRVHSECMTGDLFGSLRCDCGRQLADALDVIAAEGAGVLVYLRGHEGRGIGLGPKLQAYALQELGRDTVDANLELGFPVDSREYGVGASILADIGVHRLRLITNNPAKYGGLDGFDLELVGRHALPAAVNPHNIAYLSAKRDRLGHLLDL